MYSTLVHAACYSWWQQLVAVSMCIVSVVNTVSYAVINRRCAAIALLRHSLSIFLTVYANAKHHAASQ